MASGARKDARLLSPFCPQVFLIPSSSPILISPCPHSLFLSPPLSSILSLCLVLPTISSLCLSLSRILHLSLCFTISTSIVLPFYTLNRLGSRRQPLRPLPPLSLPPCPTSIFPSLFTPSSSSPSPAPVPHCSPLFVTPAFFSLAPHLLLLSLLLSPPLHLPLFLFSPRRAASPGTDSSSPSAPSPASPRLRRSSVAAPRSGTLLSLQECPSQSSAGLLLGISATFPFYVLADGDLGYG